MKKQRPLNFNERFFLKELEQYDLSDSQKEKIHDAMFEGVEIMELKEITKTIEDHIEFNGWEK